METFQALLTRKLAEALHWRPALAASWRASRPRPMRVSAIIKPMPRSSSPSSCGENPRALAQKILDAYDLWDLCEPPTIAGAGFINFTLQPAAIAARTAELLRDERLGVEQAASPKRIVIDFGSPNVAKPMHVGHIRSTVLGDALARIASFLGHEVIRDNHIGDWGTQFGMVIYGWKNLLDRDGARARSDRRAGSHLQRDQRESDRRSQGARGGPRRNWSNSRRATRRISRFGRRRSIFP